MSLQPMFKKLLTSLFIGLVLVVLSFSLPSLAQDTGTILIPVDKINFSPDEDEVSDYGQQDITISVDDYSSISEGATCDFEISQNANPTPVVNQYSDTYSGGSCEMIFLASQQVAGAFDLEIDIVNPDSQRFGIELVYFITSDDQFLIGDDFQIDDRLYVKPEIEFIVPEKEIEVGSLTTVQVEVKNIDNFALRNFEVSVRVVEEVARVACDSLDFTEERLEGETVFEPLLNTLSGPKVNAQSGGSVQCSDGYSFNINLSEVASGRSTKLNFTMETQKEGPLQFDVATNLDQGGISRKTDPVNVIRPQTTPTNYSWIWWSLGGLVLSIGAWYGYKRYQKIKEGV
jgi:hypothetical protein